MCLGTLCRKTILIPSWTCAGIAPTHASVCAIHPQCDAISTIGYAFLPITIGTNSPQGLLPYVPVAYPHVTPPDTVGFVTLLLVADLSKSRLGQAAT